jgi:hypothetical protein
MANFAICDVRMNHDSHVERNSPGSGRPNNETDVFPLRRRLFQLELNINGIINHLVVSVQSEKYHAHVSVSLKQNAR